MHMLSSSKLSATWKAHYSNTKHQKIIRVAQNCAICDAKKFYCCKFFNLIIFCSPFSLNLDASFYLNLDAQLLLINTHTQCLLELTAQIIPTIAN